MHYTSQKRKKIIQKKNNSKIIFLKINSLFLNYFFFELFFYVFVTYISYMKNSFNCSKKLFFYSGLPLT
jgi:hypothetical protein